MFKTINQAAAWNANNSKFNASSDGNEHTKCAFFFSCQYGNSITTFCFSHGDISKETADPMTVKFMKNHECRHSTLQFIMYNSLINYNVNAEFVCLATDCLIKIALDGNEVCSFIPTPVFHIP